MDAGLHQSLSPPAMTTSSSFDPRHHASQSQSPPQYQQMDPVFPVSPEQTAAFYSQVETQLDMSPRAPAGGDDFENYSLHGSPTADLFPSPVCPDQSSPRSWVSPDHGRSHPWGATHDGVPVPLPRQSQQSYDTFPPRDGRSDYGRNRSTATSFPTPTPYAPEQSFGGSESGFQLGVAEEQFVMCPSHYPLEADGLSVASGISRPLSACSSTLANIKVERDRPSSTPLSEIDDELGGGSQYLELRSGHATGSHSPQSSGVNSPGSASGVAMTSANGKTEEPYAQLIYRAFLSAPRHAMTLQDLYQWFRDNTEKGKSDTKGWQNSIRHNLSMNKVRVSPG